jgi:hypothetical protein
MLKFTKEWFEKVTVKYNHEILQLPHSTENYDVRTSIQLSKLDIVS